VDDRPGGDIESIDGSNSLRRSGLRCEKGSLVGSMLFPCNGGSSIEFRIACLCASVSDIQS
jgi:hypothetical protein